MIWFYYIYHVIIILKENSKEAEKRQIHSHPGSVTSETLKKELSPLLIIKTMVKYIWPRDQPDLKARVVAALGLLIGAKVSMHSTTAIVTYAVCTFLFHKIF